MLERPMLGPRKRSLREENYRSSSTRGRRSSGGRPVVPGTRVVVPLLELAQVVRKLLHRLWMHAQPTWRLVEVSQRRERHTPEALDVHPRGLWLGHLHIGVGEAERGMPLAGALGAFESAKVIRVLTPVVFLLPWWAEAVFLRTVGRYGDDNGPETWLALLPLSLKLF